MALRALALVLALALLLPGAAAAQETYTNGVVTGGRASASSTRTAAQDLADRLAVDCRVADAAFLGKDESGAPQYEVACVEGPGYRLVAGSDGEAIDCLALATQRDRRVACRLPSNRDGAPLVARMAREAGLECRVDEGVMIGLNGDREPIYEAGCAGAAGAWLERTANGWRTTDCLTVSARGQSCRFTTEAETLATFHDRLAGGPAAACQPAHLRYMGDGATGPLFETRCRGGEALVVRFSRDWRVDEIVPCTAAAHIGGGCTLGAPPRP